MQPVRQALQLIMQLKQGKKLNSSLLSKDKTLLDAVRILPELSPWVLRENPNILTQLGVWPQLPGGLDHLWKTPRYFLGRRVLANIPTNPQVGHPDFLKYVEGGPEFPSFECVLEGWDSQQKLFSLSTVNSSGKKVSFKRSLDQILLLNHPQDFGREVLGANTKLFLEDGIRANYACPITKTKVYEVALEIGQAAGRLDFSKQGSPQEQSQLLALQQEIVRKVISCFNITSFATGCDRDRIGRTDNLGLLATNGQAQCHGLSSTTSGFLYVFAELLGTLCVPTANAKNGGMLLPPCERRWCIGPR